MSNGFANEGYCDGDSLAEYYISSMPPPAYSESDGMELGLMQDFSATVPQPLLGTKGESTLSDEATIPKGGPRQAETARMDDLADAKGYWDCCNSLGQLPPVEAEDLARARRTGPDRLVPTFAYRPRRIAVFHSNGASGSLLDEMLAKSKATVPLLTRQDSSAPPFVSVLLVKYYDVHDRLGVFDGHEGGHLGDLSLSLEENSQFCDLCISNRYQAIYLADQTHNKVYALDLTGRLTCTISKRISGPQALCFDERLSLLFVCQRKKVRVFQQRPQSNQLRYVRSFKLAEFRNLTSAAARDGRLWLADSQADVVFLFSVRDTEIDLLQSVQLQNPLCISLDASGCAFVASGEPLHQIVVYDPEGSRVGEFGGWGGRANRLKLPTGVCAYQLSHLVDKRMIVTCCFAENLIRMYPIMNPETSVI